MAQVLTPNQPAPVCTTTRPRSRHSGSTDHVTALHSGRRQVSPPEENRKILYLLQIHARRRQGIDRAGYLLEVHPAGGLRRMEIDQRRRRGRRPAEHRHERQFGCCFEACGQQQLRRQSGVGSGRGRSHRRWPLIEATLTARQSVPLTRRISASLLTVALTEAFVDSNSVLYTKFAAQTARTER